MRAGKQGGREKGERGRFSFDPLSPYPLARLLARALLVLALLLGFFVAAQPDDALPTDAALLSRIQTILNTIPTFEGISVGVTEGVVTLQGEVLNVAEREELASLVSGLDGVVYVVDEVGLETEVGRTLSPALAKLREYAQNVVAFLPLLGVALLVLLAFWLLAALVGGWQAPYRRLRVNPLLQELIRQLVRTLVFAVGLLLALDVLGATPFVAAILGTAGVAGLAVGFAFRDIVENYLAGVLMSVRQPFRRNDLVEVGGFSGKVVRLTARELVLMTLEGNHVRIPNATVFKSELTNYTRNPRRRFEVLVGVDVEEDLNVVQRLGIETLDKMKGVMDDPPPFALIRELGDFNVIVAFYGWVDQREADFLKVNSQAIRLVKEAFDQAGVLMPEPITNVRVQQVPRGQRLVEGADEPADDAPTPDAAAVRSSAVSSEVAKDARTIDVSPDSHLDAQIEEEQALSEEQDLLEEER